MLKFNALMDFNLQQLFDSSWHHLSEGSRQPDHAYHNMVAANEAAAINLYTVVLRDIKLDDHQVIFYTDARSEKVGELQQDNRMSALFYDHEHHRQLIVKGKAVIHQQDEISLAYWTQSGFKGRNSYLAEQPPSTPADKPTDGLEYLQGVKFADEDLEGYQNFAVVILQAEAFEYLQLSRDEGNRRARFSIKAGEWEGSWIIP